MDTVLQNVVIAAQRFHKNPQDSTYLSQLEYRLDALNQCVDDWACSTIFNDSPIQENLLLIEILNYFTSFVSLTDCPSSLLSKILSFFLSLVWYNVTARKFIQNDLQLATPLALCLNQIVDKYTNSNLVSLILKLFQIITFGVDFLWTTSSTDLIQYLVRSISQIKSPNRNLNPTVDLRSFCIGSLNNISTNSNVARDYIRRLDSFESLCETLLSLLKDESTSVVVNSLSLITLLNEKLKDVVLSTKNLPQTFQCVFNVVIKGDHFMSRHHAVNFLRRLFEQSSIRSLIAKYEQLPQTLQNVCALFVTLDPQREQLSNIYDLFLSMCEYDSLRRQACSAVTQSGPVNPNRLTTPLLAILESAKIPTESSIIPDLPLKALKLLKFVLETVVGSNGRIQNFVSSDVLARLIEECLKSSIETCHPLVLEKCQRIVLCLQMAAVASIDEEVRTDVLEVVTPSLCAHIFEFQMISNPVALTTNAAKPAEWNKFGVKIVTELIALIQMLEPFSKHHKDIYWRFLKDNRIVPFIAFAFVSGDEKLVDQAFSISFRMAQLDGFTSKWLSELIASNSRSKFYSDSIKRTTTITAAAADELNGNFSQTSSYGIISSSLPAVTDENGINDLLEKIKTGLRIADPKISEIIELYERKIAAAQIRERQLHELDAAKTAALHQADLTISRYRLSRPESEQEAVKLRSLLHETEHKSETALSQLLDLKQELNSTKKLNGDLLIRCKDMELELIASKDSVADFTLKLATLKQANETSKLEIASEREMHDVLRKHYEKMKNNFETTSEKLLSVEDELKQTRKQLKESQSSVKGLTDIIEKLENAIGSKEDENSLLVKNVESLKKSLENLEKDKKQLTKHVTEMENEITKKIQIIKEHEKNINKMSEEVEKHNQIAQMIHKLTTGAKPPN